jgi:hypothetical protein
VCVGCVFLCVRAIRCVCACGRAGVCVCVCIAEALNFLVYVKILLHTSKDTFYFLSAVGACSHKIARQSQCRGNLCARSHNFLSVKIRISQSSTGIAMTVRRHDARRARAHTNPVSDPQPRRRPSNGGAAGPLGCGLEPEQAEWDCALVRPSSGRPRPLPHRDRCSSCEPCHI